jgi:DNA-binding IclR family transcriptional regulator
MDYSGRVITAVSLIGPRNRMVSRPISEIVDAVIKTAEEISSRLGFID